MTGLFRSIDGLLRGEFTRTEDLREGRILVPVRTLVAAGLLLGAFYGAFMGLFAVLRTGHPSWAQLVASMLKVPLLFLLTLAVTFPSLYVFSALSSSRLRAGETLRLLLIAITVTLALLASFGPITGFFTLSTESYPFMVVLNVLFFAIAGLVGVGFLRRALTHVFASTPANPGETGERASDAEGAPEPELRPRRRALPGATASESIFKVWAVIFGVVGAQMAWILRPFIGTPELPFTVFRERESNFLIAILGALRQLFH